MRKLCDNECDVVFRKDKVYVLKDTLKMDQFLTTQQSILTGLRNYNNSLWDMPLLSKKASRHRHKAVLPLPHAGLYISNKHKASAVNSIRSYIKCFLPSQSQYSKVFSDMEPLFALEECNTVVNQQLKKDRTADIPPMYHNPYQAFNHFIDENSIPSHSADVIL